MNPKIYETLQYKEIILQIKKYIVMDYGHQLLDELMPFDDYKRINTRLDETEEAVALLRLNQHMPIPTLTDINPFLKRLEIGGVLNGIELAAISRALSAVKESIDYLNNLDSDLELINLRNILDELVHLPHLTRKMAQSIAPDGFVYDDASSELKQVRRQIKQMENTIRDRLDQIIHGSQSKYLSDNLVTFRNDRYVIPVKAEYRNVFGGRVHDQSSTGQTLFIEPKAVLEINNQLQDLHNKEQNEVFRILSELSAELQPYTNEIHHNHYLLARLDVIFAKGQYGQAIGGSRPILSIENHINLIQAWHPLIPKAEAVKNTIYFGEEFQCLLITGPNTGGKTITLKTLGLIQMMGQSGLFIPASESSQIGVFREIFADIGDEQSIEQSLSTFSGHMTNIVSILDDLTERDLVLIDEIGSGTDPQEGSSLAIAILDYIASIPAYVVATTHYPELKVYGYERPNTINASMEFDDITLSPTYRLLIGMPGRSNAFDISERLGLPQVIIEQARGLIDPSSQDLNVMLADIEKRRRQAEQDALENEEKLNEAEKLLAQIRSDYEAYTQRKQLEENKAIDKANKIVSDAREKVNEIIAELRQWQLEGHGSPIKEHEFIEKRQQLKALESTPKPIKNKVLAKEKRKKSFKVGDDVFVESYGQNGTLLEQRGNQWVVQVGILKLEIAENDLRLLSKPTTGQKGISFKAAQSSHVKTEIDLRGQRYEEAEANLRDYLDAALLANYPQVTIIHGRGTMAIQKMVQKQLQANKQVNRFEFAPQNMGGNGATIAYFKG